MIENYTDEEIINNRLEAYSRLLQGRKGIIDINLSNKETVSLYESGTVMTWTANGDSDTLHYAKKNNLTSSLVDLSVATSFAALKPTAEVVSHVHSLLKDINLKVTLQ